MLLLHLFQMRFGLINSNVNCFNSIKNTFSSSSLFDYLLMKSFDIWCLFLDKIMNSWTYFQNIRNSYQKLKIRTVLIEYQYINHLKSEYRTESFIFHAKSSNSSFKWVITLKLLRLIIQLCIVFLMKFRFSFHFLKGKFIAYPKNLNNKNHHLTYQIELEEVFEINSLISLTLFQRRHLILWSCSSLFKQSCNIQNALASNKSFIVQIF
jgi:transposase-like protein